MSLVTLLAGVFVISAMVLWVMVGHWFWKGLTKRNPAEINSMDARIACLALGPVYCFVFWIKKNLE